MNELQIFKNEEFGNVRTVMLNNEVWFVGKDVAECLGYVAERNAIAMHVDEEDKLTHQISASGQNRNITIINESGVYSLVFGSKLPNAKKFKRWVTSEVLPSIRKHGAYNLDSYLIEDPIQRAKKWIEEQEQKQLLLEENKTLTTQIKSLQDTNNKVANLSLQHIQIEKAVSLRQAYKLINSMFSVKIKGEKRWFEFLREEDIINKKNIPSAPMIKKNIMVQEVVIDKNKRKHLQTKVTPIGINKLLKYTIKNYDFTDLEKIVL